MNYWIVIPSVRPKNTGVVFALFFLSMFLFRAVEVRAQVPTPSKEIQELLERMEESPDQFYDIIEKAADYFNEHPEEVTRKGSGYKELSRWYHFWKDRTMNAEDRTTDLSYLTTKVQAYLDQQKGTKKASSCYINSDLTANWTPIGPMKYESKQVMGRVDGLYYNPSNPNVMYAGGRSGGIFKSTNVLSANPTWTNITDASGIYGTGISSIAVDPSEQHFFASCGGGFVRAGVIRSLDGGITWQKTSLTSTIKSVRKVLLHPNYNPSPTCTTPGCKTVFAMSKDRIYVSQDRGNTWQSYGPSIPGSFQFWTMNFAPGDFTRLLIGGEHLFVFDSNTGSFTNLSANTTASMDGWALVCVPNINSASDGVYVLYDTLHQVLPNGSKIYKQVIDRFEINAGSITSWNHHKDIAYPGVRVWFSFFEVNPLDHSVMYAESKWNIRTVGKSTDGGENFEHITNYCTGNGCTYNGVFTHPDVRYFSIVTPTVGGVADRLLVGNDGGILYSLGTTSGVFSEVDWLRLEGTGLNITEFYGIGTTEQNADLVSGGTQDNGQFSYNKSWTPNQWINNIYGDGYQSVIDPNNEQVIYGQHNSGLLRSANGGFSFSGMTNPPGPFLQLRPNEMAIDANSNFYYGMLELYKWNGSTWTTLSDFKDAYEDTQGTNIDTVIHTGITAISVAPSNPNVIYVAFGQPSWKTNSHHLKLWRTLNATSGNPIWQDISSDVQINPSLNGIMKWKGIVSIVHDPENANRVWLGIGGYDDDGSASQCGEKRVIYCGNATTTTGPTTWVDQSSGLPPFPVLDLEYQRGSDDRLFAATDAGVFVYDKADGRWESFNTNLPPAPYVDLDINNCGRKLILGSFGRGIWQSSIPGPKGTIEITSNTTWFNNRNVADDILVKAGNTLTITNEINMAAGTRIVIEKNARLHLLGGKLTNNCKAFWHGIHIQSDPTQPQLSYLSTLDPNHGTLRIDNGTVEHAKSAVSTYSGRVFAIGAKFVDNRFGLEFLSYSFDNESHLWGCHFLCNGPLSNPDYVDLNGRRLGTATHIRLWNSRGISFSENVFENKDVSMDQDLWGTGISSLNSSFEIRGKCVTASVSNCISQQASFINLSRGINFSSTSGLHTLTVLNNKFENTVQGVLANGGQVSVYDNSFLNYKGSDAAIGVGFMNSWGLFFNETNSVQVRDNVFSSSATSASAYDFFPRGVILVNTGVGPTSVRRNIFKQGQMIGVNAWLDNEGMQLRCNDFYSEWGISVTRVDHNGQPNALPSLVSPQGTFTTNNPAFPAGNNFFNSSCLPEQHILFDGIDVSQLLPNYETHWSYFSHSSPSSQVPVCISNDNTNLPYNNASNLSPGFVDLVATVPFSKTACIDKEVGTGSGEKAIKGVPENLLADLANDLERLDGSIDDLKTTNQEPEDEARMKHILVHAERLNALQALKSTDVSALSESPLELPLSVLEKGFFDAIENGELDKARGWVAQFPNSTFNKEVTAFYQLHYDLKEGHRSLVDLSPTELNLVKTLSSGHTPVSGRASAWLSFITDEWYAPYVDGLDGNVEATRELKVEEFQKASMLSVYPVPISNEVVVAINQTDRGQALWNLEITNILGERIYSLSNWTGESKLLDMSSYPGGTYVFVATSKGEINYQRVMKK